MKNVILLNNRSLHLYDFKELKDNYNLRISAVVFDKAYKDLSDSIKQSLDKIYIIPQPISKQKFVSYPENLLCPLIEKELHQFKNTWLVTVDELSVLTAAYLREKYNLPGSLCSVILNYKSKVKQKETLAKAGMRIPKFISVHRDFNDKKTKLVYLHLVQDLKTPFILKPNDMGGTIGVEKIESYDDFCEYLIKFDDFLHLIAEEFINEQLYHCDFIIQDGRYVFAEVSEYLYNGLAYVNGSNHGSLSLQPDNPLRTPIIEFCKRANSILGLKSGSGHFEVFITNEKEIIFLEAAARPAGSAVPLVFTKMFKKNYMNAALLAEVLENPGEFNSPEEYYFWACFPKKSGVISELRVPHLKSTYQMEWYVKVKDTMIASSSVVEKAGMLLAHNMDYEILKEDFYSLKGFAAIEIN